MPIRRQLENGILFSAPHPLEAETAELLASLVPWLEQVRSGAYLAQNDALRGRRA